MRHLSSLVLASVLFASGCASAVDDPSNEDRIGADDQIPTGKDASQTSPDFGRYAIDVVSWPFIGYHGGPVLLGTTNVYYIWYGDWSGNSATSILTDLMNNIGGSSYFNINTTYYSGSFFSRTYVSNKVKLVAQTTDNYSLGKTLTDANILTIVTKAIASGALGAPDTNALYFVLTSADVTESGGFCTQYCGWHNHATVNGKDIKYSFIGNPDQCPTSCSAAGGAGKPTPNGNYGADGMASIISHELQETVTDPDISAWFDLFGQENADKCAWTFGTEYTTANGATANLKIGARDYLIQQNWVAGKNVCAKSYP
jgi:hypothetical protein